MAINQPAIEVKLPEEERLNKGEKKKLSLTILPDNCTDDVKWKSNNTNVATVDETGWITGISQGTAVIKVTVGNKSAVSKITVLQPVQNIYLNTYNTKEIR